MMFPIKYNGDVLHHNARVGVDGGIVESLDFVNDLSEQTKRVNMPLLLDIYPNAAAAYSLRKLRTAYTGAAIRVRRSSDNTETDIGFNNAGDLDTSALATFVGNGNGFVSIWYDQSGNNRNATQTTQANQPKIVNNGVIYTDSYSKPWIKGYETSTTSLVSSAFTDIPQPFSTYTVLNYLTLSTPVQFPYAVELRNGVDNIVGAGYYNNHRNYAGVNLYNTTQAITQKTYLYSSIFNTTNSLFSVNTNVATGNTGTLSAQKITLFNAKSSDAPFNGYLQEFIFYPSNQSPNRIGIETNINSYYKIYQQEALLLDYYPDAAAAYSLRKLRSGYTGAAIQVRRSSDNAVQNIGFDSNGGLDVTALTSFVGTGNTGFVSTWYDQSGNNRNATQTGTTEQPVIFSGGTVITENNKPILRFDNSNNNFLNIPNNFTGNYANLSAVAKITNSSATNELAGPIIGNVGFSNQFAIYYRTNGNEEFGITTRLAFNNVSGIVLTKLHTYTINTGDGIFKASLNNINIIDSTGTTIGFRTTGNPRIGSHVGASITNYLGGFIQEVIVWTTNQFNNQANISSNINSYYNIYPTDSDANAFVIAAGLTGTTQIQAVNKLVTDLKGYGLWGKMKAIYPFVGGTASSHKFNLKDPRDVDGAFRLVFSGGWTHSATGALPDGTTGYADTRLLGTNLNSNSLSMSYYSRTNSLSSKTLIGARLSTNWMNLALISSGLRTLIGQGGTNFDISIPNSLGFLLTNRVSDNLLNLWKNTKVGTDTTLTSAAIIPHNLTLSALNSAGTIVSYNNLECAFATIGDGLTDTEAANLYTAVQAFQTTLGRQV